MKLARTLEAINGEDGVLGLTIPPSLLQRADEVFQ